MSTIALFITHKSKPGQREALKAVWMRYMAPAIDANQSTWPTSTRLIRAILTQYAHFSSTRRPKRLKNS